MVRSTQSGCWYVAQLFSSHNTEQHQQRQRQHGMYHPNPSAPSPHPDKSMFHKCSDNLQERGLQDLTAQCLAILLHMPADQFCTSIHALHRNNILLLEPRLHVPAQCLRCEALLLEVPGQHHSILNGQAYSLTCTCTPPVVAWASCVDGSATSAVHRTVLTSWCHNILQERCEQS